MPEFPPSTPASLQVVVPLSALLPATQQALATARIDDGWDQAQVARTVVAQFDFLGPYTTGRVVAAGELAEPALTAATTAQGRAPAAGDEFLLLSFTPPTGRDLAGAERAFQRASARAERGEVRAALRELQQVVTNFPEVAKYHRAVGQAHLVLGELEAAEDAVLRALRLDPHDGDALTLLGNLYMRRRRPDDAVPLYERAVEIERTPYALSNLGAALAQQGQLEVALEAFGDAITLDPAYPNAWHGLGLTLTRLQDRSRVHEAIAALDRALAAVKERRRAPDVWDSARGLLDGLATMAAEEENATAAVAVRETIASWELSALTEPDRLPIRVEEADVRELGGVLAKIELGWTRERPFHRLVIGRADRRAGTWDAQQLVQGPEREHLALHELEHLQLAGVARAAQTHRVFVSTPETSRRAEHAIVPEIRRLAKRGRSEQELRLLAADATSGLLGQLYNFPIDLLIETRLRARYPQLRELIYFSVRRQLETGVRMAENAEIRTVVPALIIRANTAMNGALALWLEDAYPRRTPLVERFQQASIDAWSLAKRLYAAWRTDAAEWTPGAEYDWVDRWAAMLGLRDWYVWRDNNPPA